MRFGDLRSISKLEFKLIKRSKPLKEWKGKGFVLILYNRPSLKREGSPSSDLSLPFGLVISSSLGKAVVRNKLKRVLRSALLELAKGGYSWSGKVLVVIARSKALIMSYREILNDLRNGLRKLGVGGAKAVDNLESFYDLWSWPDRTWLDEGRRRFEEAIQIFRSLLTHRDFSAWLRGTGSSQLEVLDLFSGAGLGGIALAKVLKELGYSSRLTFLDLRTSALNEAIKEARLRKIEAEALNFDISNWNPSRDKYDIIVAWGNPFPHLSPWKLAQGLTKLAWAIRHIPPANGFLIFDLTDLMGLIKDQGYKELLVERTDPIVMSFKRDYDPIEGYETRVALRISPYKEESVKFYHWSLAGFATLVWHHFQEVIITPIGRYKYLILARNPRRLLSPLAMNWEALKDNLKKLI